MERELYVEKQKRIRVIYKLAIVGDYFADLVIIEKIIIELKAVEYLCEEHKLQLINYLKATDIKVGLLLNFGKNQSSEGKYFQTSWNADSADQADFRGFDNYFDLQNM